MVESSEVFKQSLIMSNPLFRCFLLCVSVLSEEKKTLSSGKFGGYFVLEGIFFSSQSKNVTEQN